MGLPMARQLRESGYDVWGFDIRPVNDFDGFQDRMIEDPAEFAGRVDTVVSIVRDWKQTQDLCFDVQGLFGCADHPTALVVSSTLSPRVLTLLKDRLPDDVKVVDAPMSGAPYRAATGTLTFMVGGNETVVNLLMPVFRVMGQDIHHLGSVGAGLACKVVNNFVASAGVVAVRKALEAAEALGIERETILDVMSSSSGGTWFGNNFNAIDWSAEGYDPLNTMGILEKDMMSFLDAMDGLSDNDGGVFEQAIIDHLRNMEVLPK